MDNNYPPYFAPFDGYDIVAQWSISEDQFSYIGKRIFVHPYTYCRIVGKYVSYDEALNVLQRFLHAKITESFGYSFIKFTFPEGQVNLKDFCRNLTST